MHLVITVQNTVILPNFLVWKVSTESPANCYAFPQNFQTRKLSKVSLFHAVNSEVNIFKAVVRKRKNIYIYISSVTDF